jgi:serine/threonine-protein phosphatase 6 regulatory ankyrin repeat subunit B
VAKINAANELGRTSLYLASKKGHLEVVKLLLEKGANINAANKSGTPLDEAFQMGYLEVIKLLAAAQEGN